MRTGKCVYSGQNQFIQIIFQKTVNTSNSGTVFTWKIEQSPKAIIHIRWREPIQSNYLKKKQTNKQKKKTVNTIIQTFTSSNIDRRKKGCNREMKALHRFDWDIF